VARSEYDSPEVDQEILLPAEGERLVPGEFREVVVTACEEYDLYGRLA
jgi:ribosomal protein S12 methylthiotransferase